MSNISDTARIINSSYREDVKIFRNVVLRDSICWGGVSIGDDTTVERSELMEKVCINRRCYINDSIIDRYTYMGINTIMNYTHIGKFCSVARNVDIGGFDHDYNKFTTMPMFRFQQMNNGGKPYVNNDDYCEIGNDVWIAAGAQVLHKVKVGDGAVIGAGAVVTKDVPEYAIVAGVPAKIIKYRFNEKTISELLEIKWWNWPEEVLLNHIGWLINSDVTEESLIRLKKISSEL